MSPINQPLQFKITKFGYTSKSYFKFEEVQLDLLASFKLRLKIWLGMLDFDLWLSKLVTNNYLRFYPELAELQVFLIMNTHYGYLAPVDSVRGVYYLMLVVPGKLFSRPSLYRVMAIMNVEETNQEFTVKFPFEDVFNQ